MKEKENIVFASLEILRKNKLRSKFQNWHFLCKKWQPWNLGSLQKGEGPVWESCVGQTLGPRPLEKAAFHRDRLEGAHYIWHQRMRTHEVACLV